MKPCQQIIPFLSILLLISALQSCATSIKGVYKNQVKLEGKKVIVKGIVISSLEFRDLTCFTVRDKSGKILVVTDNLLPVKNDKVRVKGVLERNFNYKDQTMVIIRENPIKQTKPKESGKKINKI